MSEWPARRRQARSGQRGRPGSYASPGSAGLSALQYQSSAQALSDRSTWVAVDDAARAISAVTNAAWPYAMLVRPQTVTALLAGSVLPWPPSPWQLTDRGWLIDRDLLGAAGDDGSHRPSSTFVGLGSCDGGTLLVDLAFAPVVISITGDEVAARDLMRSLVAQLQIVPENRVLMTAGSQSGRPDATLHWLPDLLSQDPNTRDVSRRAWTFLASALPSAADMIHLREQAAGSERIRVLVLGSVTGSRWSLVADGNGEVTVDGLGLVAFGLPARRPSTERAPLQVPSPAPPALPSGVPSSSPPSPPGPRHAKSHRPSQPYAQATRRKRARSQSFWPDFDDDETWLSSISPDNPLEPYQDDPFTRPQGDQAGDRNVPGR